MTAKTDKPTLHCDWCGRPNTEQNVNLHPDTRFGELYLCEDCWEENDEQD